MRVMFFMITIFVLSLIITKVFITYNQPTEITKHANEAIVNPKLVGFYTEENIDILNSSTNESILNAIVEEDSSLITSIYLERALQIGYIIYADPANKDLTKKFKKLVYKFEQMREQALVTRIVLIYERIYELEINKSK